MKIAKLYVISLLIWVSILIGNPPKVSGNMVTSDTELIGIVSYLLTEKQTYRMCIFSFRIYW